MKLNLNTFLIVALTALLTLQLYSWFGPKAKPQDNRAEIRAWEKVSESIARERDIFREWKDDLNQQLFKTDSLLSAAFTKNQQTYKPIYENLKTIGPRVDAIVSDDEQLRAAYRKRFD